MIKVTHIEKLEDGKIIDDYYEVKENGSTKMFLSPNEVVDLRSKLNLYNFKTHE